MGQGRKPLPTEMKKLRGGINTYHRSMPENEIEPKKYSKPPTPPRRLNDIGKKEWKRISKELHRLNLLTKIDTVALEAYCACYATWVQAQQEIQEKGLLVNAPSGYPIINPLVSIANTTLKNMYKFLVEFGMTPSSRTKMNVQPKEEKKDPLKEFMSKKKIERVK